MTTVPDTLTSAQINPYDFPRAYRHFFLDGYESPGICLACAGSNPSKWDKRDGTGQSGATIVYNGAGLAEFPAKIQLGWRASDLPTPQEQFAAWDAFKANLTRPKAKGEGAKTIFHPNLTALPEPIDLVTVLDVIGPEAVQPGIWEWEIKFSEYRAPKPAGTTPGGAKGGKSGSTTSGDAIDALISSLTDQLGDLAK